MTTLILLLEDLLAPFVALGVLLKFALSPRRRLLLGLAEELRERLGGLRPVGTRPAVWVHAASAGEVAAAGPLIAKLAARPSAPTIALTTTTAAGRGKATNTPGVALAALAPLDFGWAVSRFLASARPALVVLVETELWPHLIELSRRRGARVVLVNGRISARSFGRYRLIRPVIAPFLRRLELVAAQTEEDAARFRALGAENVVVAGNMKYDSASSADGAAAAACLERLGWKDARIFTAASTHLGEEELVIRAVLEARRNHPALRLVLAPRHAERAAAAFATAKALGLRIARWSRPAEEDARADALLLDTLGVLPGFFPLSFASFVGGTLVPVGGHNVLEPALAGSPVLFGPHTEHTAQAARLLESAGGGFCAESGQHLAELLRKLLADPERTRQQGELARKTARTLQGATDRTLALLESLLNEAGI